MNVHEFFRANGEYGEQMEVGQWQIQFSLVQFSLRLGSV